MAKKKKMNWWGLIGAWSFIIGFIIALLMGIFSNLAVPTATATIILLILGLIVGLLNITDKEIMPFLIACIALMIAATIATIIPFDWIPRVLASIVIFVLPAAIIASLKAIYVIARN